jgi:hypothetical protein
LPDLFRNENIPALGVQFALFLKIAAGDAGGYFLKKIVFNIIGTMGFRNQPAFYRWFPMRRAQHFGTG